MKRIKHSKLFFKEGNSDKVYEIDLCELAPDAYLVNFRYGKRGKALKEGTKTPEAVSLEKAESIFSSLEKEKRNKGYQTETEVFIEIPSLEQVQPDSIEGVILHRLQDAIEGKNSFKTEWKTSRVIWKAGQLNIREAIPYIIKLAAKGDELQLYSSLQALTKLKATRAVELFKSFALQSKQKAYIRNIANEGLLSVLENEELTGHVEFLTGKLPVDIQKAIEAKDIPLLKALLTEHSQQLRIDYFTDLYLLCKVKPELLPCLSEILKEWKFQPPFFKFIRSIYKLAQIRNDFNTLALLSYRFEKERPMFNRTVSLEEDEYDYQYISAIEKNVRVVKELRSKDSKIAFSNYTKLYFQKNALEYLKNTGKSGAKEYLKLAVSLLLQYKESDYTPGGEQCLYEYGIYNYEDRKYHYTIVNYPECARDVLLSVILFGNDPQRTLERNMSFILGKRYIKSDRYYFSNEMLTQKAAESTDKSQKGIGSAFSVIKNIFGKKEQNQPEKQEETQSPASTTQRPELYPEHWDSMPEAYIQLLMQAQMDVIHRFAYNNLVSGKDFITLTGRLDRRALLILLNSTFEIPGKLGLDILEQRRKEFIQDKAFIAEVLNSNYKKVREWAQHIIGDSPDYYTEDLDFVLKLLFNVREDLDKWINDLLQKTRFAEDRLKVMVGKVTAELLGFENTPENNRSAEFASKRLNRIALVQLSQINWDIVGRLLSSPLEYNILFAGYITVCKSEKADPTEIPLSLVKLFLENNIQGVRENGIQLLNQYPLSFWQHQLNFIFNQIDNPYREVAEAVMQLLRKIVAENQEAGNYAVRYLSYGLIKKEKFEGAHALYDSFMRKEGVPFWNSGLNPKDVVKLIHAQYRTGQLTGYEILKGYDRVQDFTVGQIISLGNHEILAIRQWCWNYFNNNPARIRYERERSLNILDSKWEDTRAFAFDFFKREFTEKDWDADTLIGIVDSVRPDVEQFGKELITQYFKPEHALEYLTKLSQHPSVNVQKFVTNYLSHYAAGKLDKIKELDFYFRSVLTRVNKARIAKSRVFRFLKEEALKNEEAAGFIAGIMDDLSAQTTIQDKATCIDILTEIKTEYPHINTHLTILN